MKKLCLLIIIFSALKSAAQTIADPALQQVNFKDLSGIAIDDTMALGMVNRLDVPIKNLDAVNSLPPGSCKIKIGLGTNLALDPDFQISLANTSQYFNWTSENNGGQVQLTGDLKESLPANFSDVASFNVKGNLDGYSTITVNFLITNHNTSVILSDENPSNNSSFRSYKIISDVTPVDFSNIKAVNKNCSVELSFRAENEINVKQFDIELSTDGRVFKKQGTISALSLVNYKYGFQSPAGTGSRQLYVRIKSVDLDGTFKYSSVIAVQGTCGNSQAFIAYPNPAGAAVENVSVKNKNGLLNGRYVISLHDAVGRLVSSNTYVLNNQPQISFPVSYLAAGQYMLKVTNENISEVIKIHKL